jgi:hypothetical protein
MVFMAKYISRQTSIEIFDRKEAWNFSSNFFVTENYKNLKFFTITSSESQIRFVNAFKKNFSKKGRH